LDFQRFVACCLLAVRGGDFSAEPHICRLLLLAREHLFDVSSATVYYPRWLVMADGGKEAPIVARRTVGADDL
jgi:hypothetical protein